MRAATLSGSFRVQRHLTLHGSPINTLTLHKALHLYVSSVIESSAGRLRPPEKTFCDRGLGATVRTHNRPRLGRTVLERPYWPICSINIFDIPFADWDIGSPKVIKLILGRTNDHTEILLCAQYHPMVWMYLKHIAL